MYRPVALSVVFGWVAACAPTAAELQARHLSATVDDLRSDLSRTQLQVGKLVNEVALITAERDAERAAHRSAADEAAALSKLQVVRLQPETEMEAAAPPDDAPYDAPAPPAKVLRLEKTRDRAQEMFHRALLAYQHGAAARAFNGFDALLKQYPMYPDADSARFWMGVCKFEAGDYVKAIAQFSRLQHDAPDSAKIAEALLKTGLAYEHLQQVDKAHTAFAELIASYPHSASAELARTRLGGRRGSDAQL